MSDTNNPNPGDNAGDKTNNVTPPTGGTDPNKTGQGEGASTVDTSKFTQADWDKIYSDNKLYDNPRFKSLNEQAKRAKILEDEKSEAAKNKLAEEKKFEELAQTNANEAKTWREKAESATLNNAIQLTAVQAGIVDVDAALKLIDRSNIKLDDTGNASGVKEAIEVLVKDKPYLKTGKVDPNFAVGGGTNPGNDDTGTPRFTLTQIQDHKFYMKNRVAIDKALKLGLIVNDQAK